MLCISRINLNFSAESKCLKKLPFFRRFWTIVEGYSILILQDLLEAIKIGLAVLFAHRQQVYTRPK